MAIPIPLGCLIDCYYFLTILRSQSLDGLTHWHIPLTSVKRNAAYAYISLFDIQTTHYVAKDGSSN